MLDLGSPEKFACGSEQASSRSSPAGVLGQFTVARGPYAQANARQTAASDANDATTMELALRLEPCARRAREHNALVVPIVGVRRDDGSVGVFPHIIMDRAKPGLIAVDKNGRRFVNEGINDHEFSVAQYRTTRCLVAGL